MPTLTEVPRETSDNAPTTDRRPTTVPSPVTSSPESTEHPRRRSFMAGEKPRILAETDRAARRRSRVRRLRGVCRASCRPNAAARRSRLTRDGVGDPSMSGTRGAKAVSSGPMGVIGIARAGLTSLYRPVSAACGPGRSATLVIPA